MLLLLLSEIMLIVIVVINGSKLNSSLNHSKILLSALVQVLGPHATYSWGPGIAHVGTVL